MRHHDQRRAGHGGGRCQQLHHLVTGCLVQCPGGLVGEDGTGATHQRPDDRDPLGLTAGHLRRAPPPEIRQAEPCEHLIGGAQCRTRRCSSKHERKSHVLPSRQLGDELAVLKDESQLAQSQMGSLRISVPPKPTLPWSGTRTPDRQCSRVDLPEPEGPMIATLSPAETLIVRPARAVTVPKRLTMSLVVISGVLMALISSFSRRDRDSARTAVEVVLGIPVG